MAAKRPRIGVTEPEGQFRLSWLCIALAVTLGGGVPVRLTASRPRYEDPTIGGLILAGGTDVNPARYRAMPKEHYLYDMARDEMEFAWLKQAKERHLPVLGICRGAQLINIARGGDLHIDIRKIYEKANYPNGTLARIFYRKRVFVKPGTLLRRLIGEEHSRVNSMHTQSINRLGDGLKIGAEEANSIVQAVEDPSLPMFMGVQFHPEYMIYAARYRRLFRQVVELAKLY